MYLLETRPDGSEWVTRVRDPDAAEMVGPRLRRDAEALRVVQWLAHPEIGAPMRFLVDVLQDGQTMTIRDSTAVVEIRPVPPTTV